MARAPRPGSAPAMIARLKRSAKSDHSRKARLRKASDADEPGNQITAREVEDIEERSSPRTPVIYEIVRRLGDEEMARPITSLWWSGVAAGLSISFSLLAQAIIQTHLPPSPWRPLVTDFGYSIGFVMVVMSRQQLFTESTITAVLPVMAEPSLANLAKLDSYVGDRSSRQFLRNSICRTVLQLYARPYARALSRHAGDQPPHRQPRLRRKCFSAAWQRGS